ncbi:MAG: hypothetical protein H8D47_01925 [Planctomycetes bacterium]|nr:hypothetical protein [Planctomycetota bacterium]MBL7107175.1 hypothetical protein [Phycisphaerae bacterium]
MNIEAFLLCDCATDQMGKLNVLGAFDNLYSGKLPASHPACAVVSRIRFEKIEAGEHQIRINIIDSDGKSIGPDLKGNIDVRFGEKAETTVANIILNIQRLKFENYGKYRIDLAIDGQMKGSLPLYVREAPGRGDSGKRNEDGDNLN